LWASVANKQFATRGVIHTCGNADGTQKIESTGPITKKRMETIDEEMTKASLVYPDKHKPLGMEDITIVMYST
jgi:arylsulfatase